MADEAVVPWQQAERPVRREELEQYLEGQQIAVLRYLDAIGPTGSLGIAFELTTGARLLIYAARSGDSKYTAVLAMRWLPRPLIILPRLEKVWRYGMTRELGAEPPDELQKRIEGQVIRGIIQHEDAAGRGGEWISVEFSGREMLHVVAEPALKMLDSGELMVADVVVYYSTPERRTF